MCLFPLQCSREEAGVVRRDFLHWTLSEGFRLKEEIKRKAAGKWTGEGEKKRMEKEIC